MHENRETSETPAAKPGSRAAGEGNSRTARMYVPEESHDGIVPMNHSNKDRRSIAAILMVELLHTAADGTLPNGHKNTVGLDELRVVQAIKQVVNVNLKRAARWARLSHAFSEYSETRPTRGSRSHRSSAHCFSHTPEEDVPFPPGV